jgi:type II secretory pathway pseudopilin PulG
MYARTVSRQAARGAYTLLEVLLASAIGILLLAALYTAMSAQLQHAQAGREIIDQSAMARALLSRMSGDIQPSMVSTLPASGNGSGGGGGGGGGGAGTGGATGASGASGTTGTNGSSNATGNSNSGSTSSNSSTSNASNTNISGLSTAQATAGSAPSSINLGVYGTQDMLMVTVNRLPREVMLTPNQMSSSPNLPVVSDQRRITYWLASSGGLARQEVKDIFSPDAMTVLPPSVPNEQDFIIAEDVRSLQFSYWDGTQWNDTWDGTTAGTDGVTPVGPPVAIAITISLARPGNPSDNFVKTYRHVVTIPTANGLTLQNGGTSYSTTSGTTGQ